MKSWRRNRLDRSLLKWNKMLLISCITALCIDPLVCYISVVDADRLCLDVDNRLAVAFGFLRTLVDFFYVVHIFMQFVFAAADEALVRDFRSINVKRNQRCYFIMDVVSILPLPQAKIVIVLHSEISPLRLRTLMILTMFQNLLRIWRMVPLYKKLTATSSIFVSRAWIGAASDIISCILASHMFGSFWYLMSVERTEECWRMACRINPQQCNPDALYCGRGRQQSDVYNSFLVSSCSPHEPSKSDFGYGIFAHALNIEIHAFLCSSLGQNLETSSGVAENLFVVTISISGLILFSFLAGNIQRYLHSVTVREDEMSVKIYEQEQWMSRCMLPPALRARVRQHERFKWLKNRGVDEQSFIRGFPKDLKRDIKRHQCLSFLTRVPMFAKLDETQLDALCCRLKPVLYAAGSHVFREGNPVDELLFIEKGFLTMASNSVGTIVVKAGELCGEELLAWALDPNSSSSSLPISTTTLQAINDVEAYCLMPDDLKCVLSQFRREEQLHHIIRQVHLKKIIVDFISSQEKLIICNVMIQFQIQFPAVEVMGCLHHTSSVATLLLEEDEELPQTSRSSNASCFLSQITASEISFQMCMK
ncbi:probable cyclic nucleotide-gated ion channel 10 isoform X2 [Salvia miltiorrhiza]|uniref:probable cyclic nucleotide-gated ion channel 10 isoform X2 n=1 Tax=Salvia miltiorrhiza TaxID=226208 RepID=UPI0025ACD6EF|nr:probable cyclic nucleotide-gated ion channel 10 isoform X2 [Salvia miltiorrhiza]